MHPDFRERERERKPAISCLYNTHKNVSIFYSKNVYTVEIISSETFHCIHISAVFINSTEHFISQDVFNSHRIHFWSQQCEELSNLHKWTIQVIHVSQAHMVGMSEKITILRKKSTFKEESIILEPYAV